MVLLAIGAFLCPTHVITWTERGLSTPVSHDHMNRNGIVHLDCWRIKIFSGFGSLVRFDFFPWGFCPMVLLSIGTFLCPPTWSHEQNGDCLHLHHVITWTEMGSYTLIVGVLKYFRFWGLCPLWFLSFGASVLWCFCPLGAFLIPAHVITWRRESWLSTPVSCDHMNRNGIVHLDCWSIKIFSGFGAFVRFDFILRVFVLWCFCPLGLFSVPPRDHMNRTGIVHTCISWSHEQKWDCTPWFLEY